MKIQSPQVKYMSNVNTVQLSARCPHGNPGGTCPACLGMGGGGGGTITKPKPTAHELGLLTWADLLPAWYAMQAAKRRMENEQKLEKLHEIKKFIEQSKLYQTINNFIDSKIMPLVKLLDSKVLTPLTKTLNQTIQTLNNFCTDLKSLVMQQLNKLNAVLNEKIQQVMEKLKQSIELFKNAAAYFISDLKEKEKALREYLLAFANKFKKKVFRLLEMVDTSMEQGEDNDQNHSHTYEELENV
jgi:hypothetical protein